METFITTFTNRNLTIDAILVYGDGNNLTLDIVTTTEKHKICGKVPVQITGCNQSYINVNQQFEAVSTTILRTTIPNTLGNGIHNITATGTIVVSINNTYYKTPISEMTDRKVEISIFDHYDSDDSLINLSHFENGEIGIYMNDYNNLPNGTYARAPYTKPGTSTPFTISNVTAGNIFAQIKPRSFFRFTLQSGDGNPLNVLTNIYLRVVV